MMKALPALRTGKARTERGLVQPYPDLELPFGIVEGAQEGPCLLVTAGVHGSEFCSIEAAQRLLDLPPEEIRGTLLVLPILNMEGFRKRSIYVVPADGKNLNRVFPGRPDGSESERLAAWLVDQVFPLADAYLDLHGGDLNEELMPFSIFGRGDARAEALARAFGLPVIVSSRGTGRTISAAAELGVPGIIAEVSGNGLWNEQGVAMLLSGVQRVMSMMEMTDRAPEPSRADLSLVTMNVLSSPADGLWYAHRKLGDWVEAGQRVGEVRDLFGKVLSTIHSSESGFVLYQMTSLSVNEGEALIGIAAALQG
jgi:predicted deacylase